MFPFILLLVSLLLTGCADLLPAPPKLSVTYITDPPGAVLYTNGVRQGFTPLTLYYDPDVARKSGGNVMAIMVRWQSGATATINPHFDLGKGLSWNQTMPRPNNVPGREADEQFGLQTETLRQQRESQEQQQLLNLMLLQQQQEAPVIHNPISCTSNAIGGTVFTNCN